MYSKINVNAFVDSLMNNTIHIRLINVRVNGYARFSTSKK